MKIQIESQTVYYPEVQPDTLVWAPGNKEYIRRRDVAVKEELSKTCKFMPVQDKLNMIDTYAIQHGFNTYLTTLDLSSDPVRGSCSCPSYTTQKPIKDTNMYVPCKHMIVLKSILEMDKDKLEELPNGTLVLFEKAKTNYEEYLKKVPHNTTNPNKSGITGIHLCMACNMVVNDEQAKASKEESVNWTLCKSCADKLRAKHGDLAKVDFTMIGEFAQEQAPKVPDKHINEYMDKRKTEPKQQDLKNVPAVKQDKPPVKREKTQAEIDTDTEVSIKEGAAARMLSTVGDMYTVNKNKVPDSAMLQKLANEMGINISILDATQDKNFVRVHVRGKYNNQTMESVVVVDLEAEQKKRVIETAYKYPHIIAGYDGLVPMINPDAVIEREGKHGKIERIPVWYHISHGFYEIITYILRTATTKAMSIVIKKLLYGEFRDKEEIEEENREREEVENMIKEQKQK